MQMATEIRDCIEIVHTAEYVNFLTHFMPEFMRVLNETQPQFFDTQVFLVCGRV